MAVTILLCYAHQDKRMVSRLKAHLSMLTHNGVIDVWDYGDINPGDEWEQEISKHLHQAQIILLLISPAFAASKYCYRIEVQQAIERHESKEARVIPVILSSVYWNQAPLDKLQALPEHAKPIARWRPQDEGFHNVVNGIVKVVDLWNAHSLPDPVARREMLLVNLSRLIETVKLQMQPPPRANATAATLQQLSVLTPNEVTLADLITGWQILSQASKQEEELAIARRRVTCSELAHLASQFTPAQGNLAEAIKTWNIWADAFKNSGDPRQAAMAETFARELAELQEQYQNTHASG